MSERLLLLDERAYSSTGQHQHDHEEGDRPERTQVHGVTKQHIGEPQDQRCAASLEDRQGEGRDNPSTPGIRTLDPADHTSLRPHDALQNNLQEDRGYQSGQNEGPVPSAQEEGADVERPDAF